ncbi:MAG: ABC transporter permease [Propionibacteriaceae bacterium]|jgi:simple sugar transport system permease protein|nr:ABC transporter permease [Propionibacteriaceae bacterium]
MSETTTAPAPTVDQAHNDDHKTPGGARATLIKIIDGSTITSILAVVVALIVGALLIAAADPQVQQTATYLFARPGDFFSTVGTTVADAYSALFQGAVFNIDTSYTVGDFLRPLTNTIAMSVPLIFAGLGLAVGFRSGLFNIGGQGQIILGAVLCGYIGFTFEMPAVLHVLCCFLGALIGGALWGFIPGFLKARTGANEVIVTIMLNSIAAFFLGWLLTLDAFQRPDSNNPVSPPVLESARYPAFFGTSINLGFVLAIAAAIAVWWLLERSTLGFRLRAVGSNPDAARTAGMSVPSVTIWAMTIAGGLCGLAATSQLLTSPFQQLNGDIAGTFGFDAITVALLGRSRPLGTVLAGLLFGGLQAGGYLMQSATGTPIDVILVLKSVIVLLIAAPPLVRAIFHLPDPERRKKHHRASTAAAARSEATA